MERNFHCPFCHGQLYINERIIFSIQNEQGQTGLILLTPDLGDYRAIKHPSFKIKGGEHLDFFCPICHKNLIVEKSDKKFTRVMMLESGEEYEILFSQIAGDRSTYVVGDHSFRAFGEDAEEFTNFWGVAPKY
jgi:uncharacterized protein YbaR (Trm112 family)